MLLEIEMFELWDPTQFYNISDRKTMFEIPLSVCENDDRTLYEIIVLQLQ